MFLLMEALCLPSVLLFTSSFSNSKSTTTARFLPPLFPPKTDCRQQRFVDD